MESSFRPMSLSITSVAAVSVRTWVIACGGIGAHADLVPQATLASCLPCHYRWLFWFARRCQAGGLFLFLRWAFEPSRLIPFRPGSCALASIGFYCQWKTCSVFAFGSRDFLGTPSPGGRAATGSRRMGASN